MTDSRSLTDTLRAGDALPRIDRALVTDLLLGTWAETRRDVRHMVKDPVFWRVEGEPVPDHRARVLAQLHRLAERGGSRRAFPTEYGGLANNGANLAGFQELVLADPSLQIKSGVQWGLFGSAIHQLGTKKHHDAWLRDVIDLSIPGAFAMTETGHGSDVAAIGTTATYDPETEEFVIHTPFRGAWKDYLGNAAVDGIAATVFAQLITGGINYGVHCFYVPIRDENGDFLPGIGGEDDGVKGGLNGVDNGRLHFDSVRIPRFNLLDRYGQVSPEGTYTSDTPNPNRRFFTMLGALVQGRVGLDGAATTATALAEYIAITYANQRRQFAAAGGTEETVLLDYAKHQRRLLPRLAETYAQFVVHDEMLRMFDDVFSGARDTLDVREDLESLAATLKPLSTWNALDTIQECREACGGAGFLAENRLVGLRHDLDIYVTFEGDNTVLLQLVGKRLLADFERQHTAPDAVAPAGFSERATGGGIFHGGGLRRPNLASGDVGSTLTPVSDLLAPEQHELLAGRVWQMVSEVANALRPARDLTGSEAAALFNAHQPTLIDAAHAHGQLLQWEAFTDAVDRTSDEGTKHVLGLLRDLFGLWVIEKHLAWHLINGSISTELAASVPRSIDRLCALLRPHAQDLVDAFGFAPEHVRAPIASGAEQERQQEARTYYSALLASGNAPLAEKSLAKNTR